MMLGVFNAGKYLNQPEMVLAVAFIFAQLFVLFLGIFYMMGAFYFSKDLHILIPLPLKPYQVLGSKFVAVMVNEYLTVLPLLLPPIIIYGTGTGGGVLYWLKGLLLMLATPVIPLILSSLFIVILMRFINIKKNKDLLAIVGGFIGLFIILGSNLFLQRIPEGDEQEFIKGFLIKQSGLIEEIGRKFPPGLWATYGLARPGLEGLGYFALFMVVSAALFAVLMWLGDRIFYRGLLSGQEVARRRRSLSEEEASRRYGRVSSPVSAIFRREWKLFLRTPVYVLNGLSGPIIGPFMLVFMLAAQGQSEEAKEIFTFLEKPEFALPVSLGGLGLMLFTAGMNVVASTALSREGQTFWIAKMIPVAPRHQVLGKLLHAFLISAFGVVVTGIMLVAFLGFSVIRTAVLLVLGLMGSMLLASLGLLTDVMHPKLDWNTPQEAMKQNVNGLFGMLLTLLIMALLGGLAALLIILNAPEWMVYVGLGIATAAMTVLSLVALFSAAERQYGKYEA